MLLALFIACGCFIMPVSAENNEKAIPSAEKALNEESVSDLKPDQNETIDKEITLNNANPLEDGKINLQEALDIALNKNRTILQEKINNNIFKIGVKKEVTKYFPVLRASHNYQYNTVIKSFSGGFGGGQNFSSINKSAGTTNVGVIQPITDIFRTALRQKMASQNYQISTLETDLQKEIIADDVSKMYFDLLKQQKIIDVNINNVNRLEEFLKDALNRYEEGIALSRDFLKIKIELENARHRLLKEKNKYKELKYQFKNLLGIDLNTEIQLDETFNQITTTNQPLDTLVSLAYDNRPEIKQLEKSIIYSNTDKNLQISEYIPDVEFFATYVNQFGSSFQPNNNFVFGVAATYDVWQWNKKYLNVKEKRYEIERKEIELQNLKDQVFIEIETQLNRISEANDLINVSQANLEYASESLRITKNRYDQGLAIILDLLDDQNTMLQSELNVVSARLDYQKTLVELQKKLGILTK